MLRSVLRSYSSASTISSSSSCAYVPLMTRSVVSQSIAFHQPLSFRSCSFSSSTNGPMTTSSLHHIHNNSNNNRARKYSNTTKDTSRSSSKALKNPGKGIITTFDDRVKITNAEGKIAELLKKARQALAKSSSKGLGYSEAKRITEEAYEIAKKDLIDGSFPKSIAVATILNDLGYFSKMEGDFAKAMDLQNEAVQCYIRMNGADHPSTLTAMYNLGVTYLAFAESPSAKNMDKFNAIESSKKMFSSLVDARKQMLKEFMHRIASNPEFNEDPDVKKAGERLRQDLSEALRKLGKSYYLSIMKGKIGDDFRAKAEQSLRESVKVMEEIVGTEPSLPYKISRALARNDLGLFLKRTGSYAEGLYNYETAQSEIDQMLGTKHELAIMIKHNIAELYEAEGFPEKADAIRNEILQQTGDLKS